MWYFGLTTLSTIGYGDYSAKSAQEKFVLGFVLLFGVSVFSYIMGNLIEILATFNSLEEVHDNRDLTKWIALLSKLSGGKKFKKSLVLKIEEHFEFYWANNPLNAFKDCEHQNIVAQLPEKVIVTIFIEYLFKELLYEYKRFL